MYPLKNTSSNGLASTVKNSKMLPIDSSRFSDSLEPCPVSQKKFIYQVYIQACKEKHLKTFARLRYYRINLAFAIVGALKDQPLRLLLSLLFYHFNRSDRESTHKSQRIKLPDVIAACNQLNVNAQN